VKKIIYSLFGLLLLCDLSNAGKLSNNPAECTKMFQEYIDVDSMGLKFSKIQCFPDGGGTSALIFFSDIGKPAKNGDLAQKVSVKYVNSDRNIILLKDSTTADQAGIEFFESQFDFSDIDGDGIVDPVIVYRFYDNEIGASGRATSDSYQGRIKIVVFHGNEKGVVRAKSGNLDHERSTTANSTFFLLPKIIQLHIRKKIKFMYEKDIFGFDNSWGFSPGREK